MHVYIVDDSELICTMLKMVCEGLGATVKTFSSVTSVDTSHTPNWIITDLNLPGLDAANPVQTYRDLGFNAPVIIVSGRPQTELDALAKTCEAHSAISKDLGLPGMSARLQSIFTS